MSVFLLAAAVFASTASARDHLSISFGGPGYGVSYSNSHHWGGGWSGYVSGGHHHYPSYGHHYYSGYRGPYRSNYYYASYPRHQVVVHHRPVVRHVRVRHVDRYDDDGYYESSNDRYYDRDDDYYDRDRYYDR